MEDFNAAQRPAWLLDKTYELGTPTRINQSEVCEYFGVRQNIISRDIRDELAPYVQDHLRDHLRDRVGMMSDVVFKTAVEKLMDGEEPYKAAKTMQMFNEWLQSTGEQDSEVMTGDIEVTFANK